MTDEQPEDAEALAALMPTYGQIPWQELIDAISEARGCKWEPSPDENYYIGHQPASGVNNMNSLNRIVSYFVAKDRAANRRAQPASGLADDARKIAEVGKLRKALEPFATFGICDDGEDIRDGLMRDRIVDWFGPSDFDAARAALAPIPEKPTPAHDDADLESAHCIRYQQARELD